MKLSKRDIQDFADHRQKMVEKQLIEKGIKDFRVLEVMNKIPRHLFVPSALQHQAYGNHALPIGDNQTISQPHTVAAMTTALKLGFNDRILEIGTGSGYQTAVLAELVGNVFSVERIKAIGNAAKKRLRALSYQNIVYKIFDGGYGWPDHAPYDGIIVTACVSKIPRLLIPQLKDGGRMVIPVGDESDQNLTLVTKTGDQVKMKNISVCKFVPLIGKFGLMEKPQK